MPTLGHVDGLDTISTDSAEPHERTGNGAVGSARSASVRSRRAPAFWLLAGALTLLLFASTAPSRLYPVYQQRWRFSAVTLTAVFSVFALALLAALLITGRLSDHVGRRPIVLVGIAVEVISMVAFAEARGTVWLFAARGLQGLGTGIAMSAISAALLDLQPDGYPRLGALLGVLAPLAGLSLGALGAGALVQYAPSPTHLVFWLLSGTFVVIALATTAIPETITCRTSWRRALRPEVAIPRSTRGTFIAMIPCLATPWALGGLIISLGPSIMARALGTHNHVLGGLPVVIMAAVSVVTAFLLRNSPARAVARASLGALMIGVGLAVISVRFGSIAMFLVATAVAGLGYGPAYGAGYHSLTLRAPARQRGGLVSAILIVAYLAFSLPALIAGVAITRYGIRDTTCVYGLLLIAVALIALGLTARMQDPR